MRTRGYSIWFMPTDEIYDKFNYIINQLSKEYNSPRFEPHVTLIGQRVGSEEEIIKKTEKIASKIKPFKIQLTTVDYRDYYFRALFVKIRRTKKIIEANKIAKEVFDIEETNEYMPHLSLLYGEFPESQKKKIIKTIRQDLTDEFEIKTIHLFNTEGEINPYLSTWYRLKEFSLGV